MRCFEAEWWNGLKWHEVEKWIDVR